MQFSDRTLVQHVQGSGFRSKHQQEQFQSLRAPVGGVGDLAQWYSACWGGGGGHR